MIKYKLICKSCNKSYDSWFSSSKEYEKLKKLKHINCYSCGSLNVEKTLMSPNVLNSRKINKITKDEKKYINVRNKIKEYQKFIKNNFEYVGKNFAYEARSIHYKDKKNVKGIYGTASNQEIKELREEGINAETIPWIENQEN